MLPIMSLLGSGQFCSENSIKSRYNGCFQASKLDEGFINGIPTFFEIRHIYTLCRRNDSLSACLNKSMFNCSSLFYDVEAYTNTFRALCTNEN
ncbi:hypothetical protein MAR_023516, partial [Mya arenaria]